MNIYFLLQQMKELGLDRKVYLGFSDNASNLTSWAQNFCMECIFVFFQNNPGPEKNSLLLFLT